MSKFSNKFAILGNESDDKDDMSNNMLNVMSFGSIERTKTNQGSRFYSVSTSSDVEIENKMEKIERKIVRKAEQKIRKPEDNNRNIHQEFESIGKETKSSSKSDTRKSDTRKLDTRKLDTWGFYKPKPNFHSKIYSGLKFSSTGILDEFTGLPESIDEAIRLKRNLTLKQITRIAEYDNMKLYGLYGEMFNVIHDHIQLKVWKHRIKITHQGRVFLVSLYNWFHLKQIEQMIEEIVFGKSLQLV